MSLAAPNAHAQASPQAVLLDAASRRAVVDSASAQLERLYVNADTGRMIAGVLRSRLRAGA